MVTVGLCDPIDKIMVWETVLDLESSRNKNIIFVWCYRAIGDHLKASDQQFSAQCARAHWCAVIGLQECHGSFREGHLIIGQLGHGPLGCQLPPGAWCTLPTVKY